MEADSNQRLTGHDTNTTGMKTLIIRLMGFGDVAAILIPAVKHTKQSDPTGTVDVLTYGVGVELMHLVGEVNAILEIKPEQWPNDLEPAIGQFLNIAEVVIAQKYDRIINLDTWFMPCFLARFLKDIGYPVEGNFINMPITEFMGKLARKELAQPYFEFNRFLESSYPNMPDWNTPWWEKFPVSSGYPEFYLRHCCGMSGNINQTLPIAEDAEFRSTAQGKKIIALSLSGSKANKQYPHGEELTTLLNDAGYHVWSQFDGSLPLQTCLGRLKVTDLLITVPTSTQWLAKLVGCPSLIISGSLPPAVLGAEYNLPKTEDCQYCCQNTCHLSTKKYSCLNVASDAIMHRLAAINLIPL